MGAGDRHLEAGAEAARMLAAGVMAWAGVTDLARREIGDWTSIVLLLGAVLVVLVSGAPDDWKGRVWLAGFAAAYVGIGFWYYQVGGGDVKLAPVVCLWIPVQEWAWAGTAMSATLLVLCIVEAWQAKRKGRKEEVPMGTAIAAGGIAGILSG